VARVGREEAACKGNADALAFWAHLG
jgi:hypothetical protein